MSATTDQVKKTIRDLLNLAENNAATEGEINNAIRFARRLMDAHHLSEDECRHDPHAAAAERELEMSGVYSESRRMAAWESDLGSFVEELVGSVKHFLATSVYVHDSEGFVAFDEAGNPLQRGQLLYAGSAEDVALACELVTTLRQTIAAMARIKFGGALKGPGRSYCEGFVSGMFKKLRESQREDSSSNESRALMVRSAEIAEAMRKHAEEWLNAEKGIKLKPARVSREGMYDHFARDEGENDGKRANVNAKRRDKITGERQRRLA